jgi:hypothetical protein
VIEFLNGAFSVLLIRGRKNVKILEMKLDAPPTVIERCRRAAEHLQRTVDEIARKIETIARVKESLAAGIISNLQAERPLKTILLSYRDLRRNLDAVEENFVGHIVRYNKSDLFFTRLGETLWDETNLPDLPPIAVTNTNGYFCTWASFGIIFSPPSTEHNLLIYPDLYHEFGHILQELIKLYGANFQAELKSHIAELRNQIRRFSRPIDEKIIDDINYKWNIRWAEEVACDTLATCIVGPAYGWCNLHLCLQNSSAYSPSGDHPADAARTRHIVRVLRRRGFTVDAAKIERIWNSCLEISRQNPVNYYQDYHPDSLFIAVMEEVEQAIKDHGITGIESNSPTIELFNQAWQIFNGNNADYSVWEEKVIKDLKVKFKIDDENK